MDPIALASRKPTPGIVLVAALLFASGCQTTVGNYFANRARDLGDCFLLEAGFTLGLGVDVKVAGLAHASLGVSLHEGLMVGLSYGNGPLKLALDHRPLDSDVGVPFSLFSRGMLHRSDIITGRHRAFLTHGCYGILPGLVSWVGPIWGPHDLRRRMSWDEPDARWLWSQSPAHEEGSRRRKLIRWARLHAFDIEVGANVLIIGARAGFSPGEFLDFLLGWFGVDVADDDRPLERRTERKSEPPDDQGVASPPPGDQDEDRR